MNDHFGERAARVRLSTWMLVCLVLLPAAGFPGDDDERLRQAARENAVDVIARLLSEGADPNAEYRDGATALLYAVQRGHVEATRVLLGAGADPNRKAVLNQASALHLAIGHPEVVELLVEAGADPNQNDLIFNCAPPGCAVLKRCRPCLETLLASPALEPETVVSARRVALRTGRMSDALLLQSTLDAMEFTPSWPQFRGKQASGVADGQRAPGLWNVAEGTRVRWTTPIPGLGHSSPVVWGNQVFITSSVSESAETDLAARASPMSSANDRAPHRWMVFALDRQTGDILWKRVAREGDPLTKRSPKNSYASETPATDGRRVFVSFGSHGLYAYDLAGNLLWQRDLGVNDAGFFYDPDYEWGTASSPVLFGDLVIVQVDRQEESFIAAFEADSGKERWKTTREELPSWATPTVVTGAGEPELVTNGVNATRAYAPSTGELLWELKTGNSVISAATPVFGGGLILAGNGYRPLRPLYAVRVGSRGDISLGPDQSASASVAWSKKSGGPYYVTPLVYRDLVYVLSESGILTTYYLQTGERVYRQRVGSGRAGFSASPVAADGKIYLAGEDGNVYVVAAGLEFELLATNPVGEMMMATPAIVDGMIILRGRHNVIAIAQ